MNRQIYICHAERDRDQAEALADKLSAAGERTLQRSYFIRVETGDQHIVSRLRRLKTGEIPLQMAEAEIVLLYMTEHTWKDQQVLCELMHAKERGLPILPLYLRQADYPEDLPPILNDLPHCRGVQSKDLPLAKAVPDILARVEELLADRREYPSPEEIAAWREQGIHMAREERYEEAVICFQRAAEAGDPESQYQLGTCCEFGRGMPEHVAHAMEWYRLAAASGHTEAQFRLGMSFFDSADGGCRYFRLAAEAGHPEASYWLGLYYEYGIGIRTDFTEAAKYLRVAADAGLPPAQFALARLARHGIGMPQDGALAIRLYRAVAATGDIRAQCHLGECLEQGIDGEPRPQEALALYRQAAESGDHRGQVLLGLALERGVGTPPNPEEAAAWYRRAAVQRYDDAQYRLGLCYERGIGVEQNGAEAISWLEQAAYGEHKDACFHLGMCYEHGICTEPNVELAKHWYRRAAAFGHKEGAARAKALTRR